MTPWTFDIKFLLSAQFTFGSLTFVVREDADLKMLPPGPALEHPALAPSSTSGGVCSGLDPFAGLYIRTAKLIQSIPIVTSIFQPFAGASSSSSSASSPSQDSSDDYPEIEPVPVRIPQKTFTSSLWCPQMGISPATALVDIPLLEDQRHLMPELLASAWFRI
jgi:hypothetical protein